MTTATIIMAALARDDWLSPYTKQLLGPDAKRQEQLWAAAFADHAVRLITTRGVRPARGCVERATCSQPLFHTPSFTEPVDPICFLCALDSAVNRHSPDVSTTTAQETRNLYRAAKIAVTEILLTVLTLDTTDEPTILRTLRDVAAEIRAVGINTTPTPPSPPRKDPSK